jgi:hypothetical protein
MENLGFSEFIIVTRRGILKTVPGPQSPDVKPARKIPGFSLKTG